MITRIQFSSRTRYSTGWVLCGLSLAMVFGLRAALAADDLSVVERVDPPQFGFYAKSVDCDGILIRGSASVQDSALIVACTRIGVMLGSTDVTWRNLKQRGVELHIVGREESVAELPENGTPRGRPQDAVVRSDSRGTGGIYSACGEESLVASPNHGGEADLCMREFAIAVMDYGFDAEMRRLIETQYRSSVASGHWRSARGAASPEEFWAELSMRYFGSHAGFDQRGEQIHGLGPGPDGLRQYDPAGYALLDLFYTGRKRPVAVEAVRARSVSKLALSGTSKRPAELQLVNNSGQRLRIFWIDTDGEMKSFGELGPYNRVIEKTFFSHVWMIEDERGVEIQRFVVESYVSEVIAAD